MDSEEQLAFADAAAFDRWLRANHASCPGVWVRIARKGSGRKTVSYPEALEVALAWGWIDALKRRLDDIEWLQRFTPRGRRSPWSKINCAKAEATLDSANRYAIVDRSSCGRCCRSQSPPDRGALSIAAPGAVPRP